MSLAQRLHRWGSPRRLTALLLLVVASWMLFPLSLQFSPADKGKDASEPFPCQNRPCGCKTADQCWKKCCCFTNAQKVAWANSRSVKVPSYVVQAAQTESRKKSLTKACCQSHAYGGRRHRSAATGFCHVLKTNGLWCGHRGRPHHHPHWQPGLLYSSVGTPPVLRNNSHQFLNRSSSECDFSLCSLWPF